MLCIAGINAMTKSNLERKEKAYYILQLIVHYPGKLGRSLEAGAHIEAMDEWLLLTCSSRLAYPASLQYSGPPAEGWHHHKGLGPPTSVIMPIVQPYGSIISIEVPSS